MDFVEDVAPLTIQLSEQHGLNAGSFYGRGLSGHDKDQLLRSWRAGEIQVMVATKAFGLGVNQPDIEVVVRIGVPSTLEELIQQFGRASRDGRAGRGTCVATMKRPCINITSCNTYPFDYLLLALQ